MIRVQETLPRLASRVDEGRNALLVAREIHVEEVGVEIVRHESAQRVTIAVGLRLGALPAFEIQDGGRIALLAGGTRVYDGTAEGTLALQMAVKGKLAQPQGDAEGDGPFDDRWRQLSLDAGYSTCQSGKVSQGI